MPYTPVLATLGYVLSPDEKQVLLIHRDKNPADHHFGKYNGLGGKVEPQETIVAGMQREIMEEAGITCERLSLRGTISWPGFGKRGEDWFGFLFVIHAFSGTPLTENAEGSLLWVNVDQLMSLSLWEGDRDFLPLVFDPQVRQFHGVMPYHQGKKVSWTVSVL